MDAPHSRQALAGPRRYREYGRTGRLARGKVEQAVGFPVVVTADVFGNTAALLIESQEGFLCLPRVNELAERAVRLLVSAILEEGIIEKVIVGEHLAATSVLRPKVRIPSLAKGYWWMPISQVDGAFPGPTKDERAIKAAAALLGKPWQPGKPQAEAHEQAWSLSRERPKPVGPPGLRG